MKTAYKTMTFEAGELQLLKTDERVDCPRCKRRIKTNDLRKNLLVCPDCGHHFPLSASDRVTVLADKGSFREKSARLKSDNPLDFPDYKIKLKEMEGKTGNNDAIVSGVCEIEGHKTVLAVLDSKFMMGSMGTVVGERFTRAVEYAMKKQLPLVAVSASGGARMQEGMYSLVQMAKTSAAVERFSQEGGFFISVLTHPTMGGVSASFAMLGDVILAEPKARIGFAGPRVIEQTINQKLPKGFQRSEFQREHGFVDKIVERKDLREIIGNLLALHEGGTER